MKILNSLSIAKKLNLLAGFLIFATIINVILAYFTIDDSKINGEKYKKIILGKDLIADILPPPAYIIETYLVCNQLYFETDSSKIEELIKYTNKLQTDFETREKFWVENLDNGEMKRVMTISSYDNAINYYKTMENEFIPAIRKGDKQLAYQLITGKLKKDYELHRADIDKVVIQATNNNSVLEANSKSDIDFHINIMIVTAIISILLSLIFTNVMKNIIVKPLLYSIEIAKKLAKGNFNI